MNKKLLITLISCGAALVIGLAVALIIIFSGPTTPPLPLVENPEDIKRTLIETDSILDEDFSDVQSGTLPEGWDKTHPYAFLNSAKQSTSLATTGGNKNHVAVATTPDGNYLGFSGRDGEHILTLPDPKTEDYSYSVSFNFTSFKHPFGLAVDIGADPKKATSALLFTMQSADPTPDDDSSALAPTFSIVRRSVADGKIATETLFSGAVADLLPDLVDKFDSASGDTTIFPDREITLSVLRHGSKYYFYCGSTLVSCVSAEGQTLGPKVGIFSSVEGREVKVKRVSIRKLSHAADAAKALFSAGNILTEDFSSCANGTLPKKWKTYSGKWLPNGIKDSAAVKDKVLTVSSKEGAAAVILPTLDSRNAVITVELTADKLDGEIGLVTGIGDQLQNSAGGHFSVISAKDGKLLQYNLNADKRTEEKSYDISAVFKDGFKDGDTLKLTVYCCDGRSYFFINDLFVSHNTYPLSGVKKQHCGIYTANNSGITVKRVTADYLVKKGDTDIVSVMSGNIGLSENTVALTVTGSLSTKNPLYKGSVSGEYAEGADLTFGFISVPCDTKTPTRPTKDTKGALITTPTDFTEQSSAISFSAVLPEVKKEDLNRYLTVRGFVAVKKGDTTTYFYGEPTIFNPPALSSNLYLTANKTTRDKLDGIFKGCDKYIGKYEKTVTFALFSDFHYKQGMYSTSIADMNAILDRANKANASFILSGGDFCNDFKGSPELMKAFLENKYNMPAYNIYGNHELEAGNSMDFVTPLLTNDKNVVWGTKDGKIGDGSIAYYYVDRDGFRIVCTDTNYSYNPQKGQWEHNTTGSYGPPAGNTSGNSLGPDQLLWLEETLFDAARNGIPCIVISHDSFAGSFRSTSPDAAAVRDLYNRVNAYRKGTVLLSINGHIHTDNNVVRDGVLYIDMNTTRNCEWKGTGSEHYTEKHTFDFVEYDDRGNPVATTKKSLGELTMGKNTWFSEDPLSAIVTISQYGSITVEGIESRWIYGIDPKSPYKDTVPRVSSGHWELIK